MNPSSQNRPLTDAEIEALEERLAAIDPDDSMAVEELDGFFAALACCPEPLPREEWLPLVLGGSERGRQAMRAEGDDAVLMKLIERHRVAVAATLFEGKGFDPVLAYDEAGRAWGNAWAIGFARGMAMRPDAWAPLDEDETVAEALDPVMRLVADAQQDANEGADSDAESDGNAEFERTQRARGDGTVEARAEEDDEDDEDEDFDPIADDEREAVIHDMLDGVQDVYEFFRTARARALAPATVRRTEAKVGRNDLCACGSGRKFKNCHGSATLH
jgi:uncharacterized protein